MADDGQLRTDVHTPEQRSFNMSRIRSRDTKPELQLRRGLHAAGFRYRLDVRDLPGRPDLVFPRHRAVAFVHGCFWHGHDCSLFKLPTTRTEFWTDKIQKNRARDARATTALRAADWRVLTVWECAFRGPSRLEASGVIEASAAFLRGLDPLSSLAGRTSSADSDADIQRRAVDRFYTQIQGLPVGLGVVGRHYAFGGSACENGGQKG